MQKSVFTPDHNRFCALLRRVRIEANLTQVELARLLNTPASRVSDYERGERRMDVIQLQEYLEPLGMSLLDFIKRYVGEP